ncbi:Ig-like domain-containing protein [Leifsonia xyli]|uniref:Ig-like domain-containing protein n=1 Tax=Leifsonia xyli TaxID=1575 RepID=UPI00351C32DC
MKVAAGQTTSGALVTFQSPSDASLSASSCTTTANGTCAVQLTSTKAGTYPIHAFLQETKELGQSPASAAFTASAASPLNGPDFLWPVQG